MKSNKLTYAQTLAKIAPALVLFFSSLGSINAQQIKGIYASGLDFSNNKTILTKEKKIKCKIKLHQDYFKPYIEVRYKDTTYTFLKDSIFGYRDRDDISYRFFNKQIFTVLNQGETILLYKIEKATGNIKSQQTITKYYFSNGPNNPIKELTIPNLELCFAENPLFKEFLEVHFKNQTELLEYDDKHKIYKLNRLLELSLTHKTN